MTRAARPGIALVCVVVVAGGAALTAQESARSTPVRQVAYLKASNPGMFDHFGEGGALDGHSGNAVAVSADGTTLAVGAQHESSSARGGRGNPNDDSAYSAGAVYVFTRAGNSWAQQAYLKASNAGEGDHFGNAVALSADGNTLAVSAFWESSAATGVNGNQNDNSLPQAGAVYLFARSGTAWTQQAYIKPANPGRGDWFGVRLALSGDGATLAVGAQNEDGAARGVNGAQNDDATEAGAVYLFTRSGTTWSQVAYIKGANTEAFDEFGGSVALSRDGRTLLVGARGEDSSAPGVNGNAADNAADEAGAVYVFSR